MIKKVFLFFEIQAFLAIRGVKFLTTITNKETLSLGRNEGQSLYARELLNIYENTSFGTAFGSKVAFFARF